MPPSLQIQIKNGKIKRAFGSLDNDIGDTVAQIGGCPSIPFPHALGQLDMGLFTGIIFA